MDFKESTKVVYNRIQAIEPEHVPKIILYLLLQDHGDRDMIGLAFSPDTVIHSLINKAKNELGLSKPAISVGVSDLTTQFTPFSNASSQLISASATLRTGNGFRDYLRHNVDVVPSPYADQLQYLNMKDESAFQVGTDYGSAYNYTEPGLISVRTSRNSSGMPEFPVKVCHYFNKGFCKHGNNCRYFHGQPLTDNFSHMIPSNSNELPNEEQLFTPGSLEKLELELTELLKSRRGFPVSIASLPMMYYEKYGRTLQAKGYLTESQRHGKAGYSLTKLLARLKNSIRLIDRPHGQHSVILAEDLPKYLEFAGERNDAGGIILRSRQIYLTFPADSTFTEQDVSNYFNKFGPVQDVRIPCQQMRMFGFVTFAYPETVKKILTKGNPHFVCGARVLVKPYREKSRLVDRYIHDNIFRKHADRTQNHIYYSSQFIDGDSELHSLPRTCDNSFLLRKQLIQDHEKAVEQERRRLKEFQLITKPPSDCSFFGFSLDDLKLSEAPGNQVEFPSCEQRFNYFLNVLNNGSTTDEKMRHIKTKYDEQDSQGLNLPDSPFASAIGSGISTAI